MHTSDLDQLTAKGITPEQLEQQLQQHRRGFPRLDVTAPATPGEGITVLSPQEEDEAIERWKQYLADGGTVSKFVPASGAASRMFKAMYEFVGSGADEAPEGSAAREIVDNLERMPFRDDLDSACHTLYGTALDALRAQGRHRDIISALIAPEGLNYGGLPKGLLKFHSYPEGSRTPLEEHLTEGAQTAADASGTVRIHFTVSHDHMPLFQERLKQVLLPSAERTGATFEVGLSEQKPSTDTVAANPDGTPFRNPDGSLLFRPGGHGALIANLSDIDSTVVFVKNIDNVVPDSRRDSTVRYKQVLAGYLIELHDELESLCQALEASPADEATLARARAFVTGTLGYESPEGLDSAEGLLAVLRRPLRVCGMVRNEGEPGGGPYITWDSSHTFRSPQILESNQIDTSTPEGRDLMARATHFNPVDLVCYLRDIDGSKFDLTRFTDPATGFISSKSSHGRELRALELPGLWNGAMGRWNTVFVEVPASTFNPVKTVNDLLRPAHQ